MITRRPTPRKPRRLVSFAGSPPPRAPKAEPKSEPVEEIELADEDAPPKRKGKSNDRND